MSQWIFATLGPDVPLHFSAFHPDWKMRTVPHTPADTLTRARAIAMKNGLQFVYTGNVHDRDGQTTTCPSCGDAVVVCDWYQMVRYDLTDHGACAHCGAQLPGRYDGPAGTWGSRRLPVRLAAPPTDGVFPMEMHSGMSDEDTPLFDWPGPAGTWLDLADAHWLTTASLVAAAELHPDGDWDVRRFRPTALIETSRDGFAEDGWSTVDAGEVGSTVLMPTPRCTMPSRAQPGLPVDKAIGTTIRDQHQNNLGLYASVARAGTIRTGDIVNAS